MVELFRLLGVIAVNRGQAEADIRAVDKTAADAAKRIQRHYDALGKKLTGTGMMLSKGITLPLVALAAASVKVGADFEAAMTESLAIMGEVSDEMRQKMEEAARSVAKETTFSATEAAKAYYYLASAGLNAAQSISALPQVAKFAQAGVFDLSRATEYLADAQSALGLTVTDTAQNLLNMTRISDVLVKANILSNASVEQFAEALTNRAAAALRLLNKDVEEGVAVLAVYAGQGVKGAAAGEQLAIVLRDLQRAALKQEDAFKKMGIAVFDAHGKVRPLADILEDMEKGFKGLSDAELRSTLMLLGFQDRSVAALMTLLGTSDAIRAFEKALRSAGGITEEVASKQLESLAAQWKLIRNQVLDFCISLSKILIPLLREHVLPTLSEWLKRLQALNPEQLVAAVRLAAIAAAIGPLLLLLGKFILALPKLIAQLKALQLVLAGAAGPVALIIALGAALYFAADGWLKYWEASKMGRQAQLAPEFDTARIRQLMQLAESARSAAAEAERIWDIPTRDAALKQAAAYEALARKEMLVTSTSSDLDAKIKELTDSLEGLTGGTEKSSKAKKTAVEKSQDLLDALAAEYHLTDSLSEKQRIAMQIYDEVTKAVARFSKGTAEQKQYAAELKQELDKLDQPLMQIYENTVEADEALEAFRKEMEEAAEGAEMYGAALAFVMRTTAALEAATKATMAILMQLPNVVTGIMVGMPYQMTQSIEALEERLHNLRYRLAFEATTLTPEDVAVIETEIRDLQGRIEEMQAAAADSAEEATDRFEDYWLTTLRNVKSAFSDFLVGVMEGTKGFVDFFSEVTKILRRLWADMVADMVTDWLRNMLDLPAPGTSGGGGGGGKKWWEYIPLVVPFLQHGGLVKKPTLAVVGEQPEYVLPLSGTGLGPLTESLTRAMANLGPSLANLSGLAGVHFHEGAIQLSPSGISEWDMYKLGSRLRGVLSMQMLDRAIVAPTF